jgi:hypothetical protein
VCPAGKTLTTTGHIRNGDLLAYLASVRAAPDVILDSVRYKKGGLTESEVTNKQGAFGET